MRLRPPPDLNFEWPSQVATSWERLASVAAEKVTNAGQGRYLESIKDRLLEMVRTGQFSGIGQLLKTRSGARACTRLWLDDPAFRKAACKTSALKILEMAHQPRLSRLTLSNLCELYLTQFDLLESEFMAALSRLITDQCDRFPMRDGASATNVWQVAKQYPWIFSNSGPRELVEKVHHTGQELEAKFQSLGLSAYVNGRYGQVCRALYYLDTLKNLPYGEYHPVMDELLKPAVHDAPFEDGLLVGHAALCMLIDRVEGDVPERWQQFVLHIAGDPRVSSGSASYRKWWQALGVARIEKVRGWLSKMDLRLFLDAVEQYGKEAGDQDLQRMFPARKRFLEGLLNEKLVRNTRLMLGWNAERIIKRILGEDSGLSYAHLTSGMSDKAVIYIDCGQFYFIEGSHSFKLWIYLDQPDELLTNYNKTSFTHSDLTRSVPRKYQENSPGLPHVGIPHNGTWQRRVFEFLGENGIGLDIEKFLLPKEYRAYMQRFGPPFIDSTGRRRRRTP